MATCVSRACGQTIDDGFAFCPYCGTDNRPPENRPPIPNCAHQDVEGGGFCVLCGEALWDPSFLGRAWRMRAAALLLVLGFLAFVVAGFLNAVNGGSVTLFGGSIRPWYRQVLHFQAYTSKGVWYPPQDVLLGDQVCNWLVLAGGGLILLSLITYFQPRVKGWSMPRFERRFR
ncbi:MAG TPA: zinc ribbon domain-containing protein [Fimbriimonadaceae bacterium]|nr:zinc ribbon domain-containing protein [Fimbriimonadaceae bacterium]